MTPAIRRLKGGPVIPVSPLFPTTYGIWDKHITSARDPIRPNIPWAQNNRGIDHVGGRKIGS